MAGRTEAKPPRSAGRRRIAGKYGRQGSACGPHRMRAFATRSAVRADFSLAASVTPACGRP